MQSKHLRLIGSKIDPVWFKESFLGVLQVFTKQILNDKSNIVGETDVRDAEKILVSCIDEMGSGPRNYYKMPRAAISYTDLSRPNYALPLQPLQGFFGV